MVVCLKFGVAFTLYTKTNKLILQKILFLLHNEITHFVKGLFRFREWKLLYEITVN
jgi:hypothetical protein